MKTGFLLALAYVGAALSLRADPVILFDDLPSNLSQVPASYHLLNWINVGFTNGSTYPLNPSGFGQGIVSSNNVIYGGGGTTSVIQAQMFDFLSAYATGAFNDNLQLEAKGYINGSLVYDQTNSLSASAPTLINYDFYGVNEVDFTSSGGTHHAGYTGFGTQFVMDNVNVTTYLPFVAPLVTNGGFEMGNFSGWSQGGNLEDTSVTTNAAYVHSGSYGAQIGPVGTPGYLSQTIQTQVQHSYLVDFWLENEEAGSNYFLMSCDNIPSFAGANSPAFGWTHYETGFLASRPTTTVLFEFVNNPSFWGLDDFSVTDDSSSLLLNGGFETGDLSGWGEIGNTSGIGVSTTHRVGTYGAFLGPIGSPGYILQLLGTHTGQPYLISFWLENPTGDTPNEFHASWATAPVYGGGTTESLADQTNLPAFGWTNVHYTVVPNYFQNYLQLGARNDPNYFYLDEVSFWPVPLVQNGSFEFGDFTGWTRSGNLEDTFVSMGSGYANEGFYGAQLGPVGSLGYLSQTMTTVPGQSYLIHFEIDNPQPMTNTEFNVSWNGIVLMDTTNEYLLGWLPFEFIVPATGTNTTLQFGFRDDPSYLGLDNVSVTAMPTPSIQSITKTSPSSADLSVNVIPDYLYEAQYTTNLAKPNWTAVGSGLMFPTNYPMDIIDTNATDKQRFYRVLMEPPPLIF